jgi:outer membrane biosynthesis protein TonB
MTPEEKQALLQFMGVTYGHTHKLDTGIVGSSQFVQPISTKVKQTFEQLLKTDTVAKDNTPQHQPVQEQIIPEPAFSPPVPNYIPTPQPQPGPKEPVKVNSDVAEELKNINLQLTRIGDILHKAVNGRTNKKTKSKVQE